MVKSGELDDEWQSRCLGHLVVFGPLVFLVWNYLSFQRDQMMSENFSKKLLGSKNSLFATAQIP
jgi:hypothetical protein